MVLDEPAQPAPGAGHRFLSRPAGESSAHLRLRLGLPRLEQLEQLYAQRRYVDAFERSRAVWSYDALSLGLDASELVLGARLASKLGAERIDRALSRLAVARAPDDPGVQTYLPGGGRDLPVSELIHQLSTEPPPATDDTEMRVDYCGYAVRMFAMMRDFEQAETWLATGKELGESPWLWACEAALRRAQDRFDEAVTLALRAWEAEPGGPATGAVLVDVLSTRGRTMEAVEQLLQHDARHGQSYELLFMAVVRLLTEAQRSTGAGRVQLAGRAHERSQALESLAPLAERPLLETFEHFRAECARVMGDHARLRVHAARLDSPFYREVSAALERGDRGKRQVLPHDPVAQHHDTCLPASVATVASCHGLEVDQAAVAQELTYAGTALWRAVDHAASRGWASIPFTVTAEVARRLLGARLPFVIVLTAADQWHACAAVGLDPATGTLVIHDPGVPASRDLLLDKLDAVHGPLGPVGLLLLPPGADTRLPGDLQFPDRELHQLWIEYERARELDGPLPAAAILEPLAGDQRPLARYLHALRGPLVGRPTDERRTPPGAHRALPGERRPADHVARRGERGPQPGPAARGPHAHARASWRGAR